ncbi:MAG: DUF3418 domain-containing protein, partial [Rubrivivax sp.]
LEAPPKKAIADGYALLDELNAIDQQLDLTPIGQLLSRLPLDPRVGRMILEARDRQSLSEVLIIASALSGQDVRDRPLQVAQAADEQHKKFDDERSEFVGLLKLWQWIEQGRGHADGSTHKLSNRQQEQRLRDSFINPRRVREWRDIHSQLHTVVAEHGWRLNSAPATYEQIHLAMLSGLLGNIGIKSDDEEWYLGARGIKFWRHPGAHLSKKPARWLMAAELVDTTKLYGRGLAAIELQWIPAIAGHLLKTQLLEPHWEKKAGEVVALERATLYGLVIYSNKRVNFGRVDPVAARDLFIREALVQGDWDARLPFLAHNRKLIGEVQDMEHKARRQDVLVDDELIFAFYDQQLPAEVCSGASLERWYRDAVKTQPALLRLSRDELMRHEAAGITTEAFPRHIRLGGIDCAANYLHDPGDAKDGVTVTVPIYALNQVNEERCDWLVPGMLQAKVLALCKTLHQRPRSRLVPLPDFAAEFVASVPFAQGALLDVLLKAVRERCQLAVQRNDFKPEQLPTHLLMNFRVVDENGRQLGAGRQLSSLKAELGTQARTAFQALAELKLRSQVLPANVAAAAAQAPSAVPEARRASTAQSSGAASPARFTTWSFGELPELMEIRRGPQSLVGFPALIDKGDGVEIEVFDEPEVAAGRHRVGLRRLLALQLKEPLKQLQKSLPDFLSMAAAFQPLGSADELREQIIELALQRAFLADAPPIDAAQFDRCLQQGRARLGLIAQELARLAGAILAEYSVTLRKLKDSRAPKEVVEDIQGQLQRLLPKRFMTEHDYAQLLHLPRYLKAIDLRLDKLRADAVRDAARMAELRPLEQRHLRRLGELKGASDARLEAYRWLLEELRVSLFAQELRTPQPVSVKRLDKAWEQLSR